MSRQMLFSVGFLVMAFVCGVGLGLFLGSSGPGSSGKSTGSSSPSFFSSPEASERNDGNTLLSERIRELEKELTDQKKEQDGAAIMADRFAFFKKHHDQMHLMPFTDDLKVTATMADFLNLTDQEKKAVEQHLVQIEAELGNFESANLVLLKQSPGSVSYAIPANPEGKQIKDELQNLIVSDIGSDRAEVFLDAGQRNLEQRFSDFDQENKQIEITSTPPVDGSKNYQLMERWTEPAGDDHLSARPMGATLPAEYAGLLQLPPGR